MNASDFASTPKPPYYAVIFTSQRTPGDDEVYGKAADHMVELASQQPGFLGIESVRAASGVGITVSYWVDEEAIAGWRRHAEHVATREHGRRRWYEHYEVRVAKIERAYAGPPDTETS